MTKLEEIRKRLEKATPGPWYEIDQLGCDGLVYSESARYRDVETVCAAVISIGHYNANLDDIPFIANAPTDIDYLLRVVDELERVVRTDALHDALRQGYSDEAAVADGDRLIEKAM